MVGVNPMLLLATVRLDSTRFDELNLNDYLDKEYCSNCRRIYFGKHSRKRLLDLQLSKPPNVIDIRARSTNVGGPLNHEKRGID